MAIIRIILLLNLKCVWGGDMFSREESVRPTLYRGLKYWGKKPHNIWRDLIVENTKPGDIVYDPFAGSALTFFESIKAHRKPVICDINPLTLFLVDLYSKTYDLKRVQSLALNIIKKIKNMPMYSNTYVTKCANCNKDIDIYNFKHLSGKVEYISYKCPYCHKTITQENNITFQPLEVKEDLWRPTFDLSKLSSVTPAFIKKIGGKDIANLWTNRNIWLLSILFHEILSIAAIERDALMFGFLQIVHLTTKMCALRGKGVNRPLSTSWGRPAYLGLTNFMEQNPIVQFERAILGNAGVLKCLKSRNEYLPQYNYSSDIKDIQSVDGIAVLSDCKNIKDGFKADFMITDPPYGSVIQYGELSQVWNVWLEKYDKRYRVSLENEIIVNKNSSYSKYINDMTCVLRNCRNILKKGKNFIMTFNSNNNDDWKALSAAIDNSGFEVVERCLQKNKRSSEANVQLKEGIGISDYYFLLTENLISNWRIECENQKVAMIHETL